MTWHLNVVSMGPTKSTDRLSHQGEAPPSREEAFQRSTQHQRKTLYHVEKAIRVVNQQQSDSYPYTPYAPIWSHPYQSYIRGNRGAIGRESSLFSPSLSLHITQNISGAFCRNHHHNPLSFLNSPGIPRHCNPRYSPYIGKSKVGSRAFTHLARLNLGKQLPPYTCVLYLLVS